ncbi:MAG: hypothetical protein K2Q01_05615 [Rickettsiales bacterium]|nr:hypothetical protein [Rickettsiales bacterium]
MAEYQGPQRPQYRYRPNSVGRLGDNAQISRFNTGREEGVAARASMDLNGDGRVTLQEKREVFAQNDLNGDGIVTRREILERMELDGERPDQRAATALAYQLRDMNARPRNYGEMREGADANLPPRFRPMRVGAQPRPQPVTQDLPRASMLDDDSPAVPVPQPTRTTEGPQRPAPRTTVSLDDDDVPARTPPRRDAPPVLRDADAPPRAPSRGFRPRTQQPDTSAPVIDQPLGTDTREARAMQVLREMDRNRDGVLTGQEIQQGMMRLAQKRNTRIMDVNGDGRVTPQEVYALVDKMTIARTDLSRADLSGDGRVDRAEAIEMLKALDANGDKKVSMQEAAAAGEKFGMSVEQLGAVLRNAGIQFQPDRESRGRTSSAMIPAETPNLTAGRDNGNEGRGS